jgi:hypothetical protein
VAKTAATFRQLYLLIHDYLDMKSQWECVLENLGGWIGSFTVISPQGELIEDIPSLITLAGVRDNRAINLVLKRFYSLPNSNELFPKEVTLNFSTPNPGALFFETGAFSDGAISISHGVKTIAEFCLVGIDRRWRMVQVFNDAHRLDRVTLIREQRQGTDAPERPQLTIEALLGTWQGTAITLSANDRSAVTKPIQSTCSDTDDRYQWSEGASSIDLNVINDRLLQFELENQSYQILLLPDSGYSLTPTQIVSGQPFYLEVGWIHQPGLRQRLVRRYDNAGAWHSATFITESKN